MKRSLGAVSRVLLTAFVLGLWGCAIPKFDPSRRVERHESFLGDTYRQDGKVVDQIDLGDQLSAHPASKEKMPGFRTYNTLGLILGSIGGAMIGWQLGLAASDGTPNWNTAYIGGGVAAVGIVFGALASRELGAGVDAFNGSFGSASGEKSSRRDWSPVLIARRDGAACGVQLGF
ncbi:MAG: hypothetical protein NDJ89_10145 [Oligoflexia bacterium]|nr:hypothetical protein [Oligoflexia bacterium]